MPAFALPLVLAALTLHWIPQTSHSSAGLRGLTVTSHKIIWASGTKGTVLRTLDGGANWEIRKVPGADDLDFRDIEAFDAQTALVMASGTGTASRIYLTKDGGQLWTIVFSNPDPAGFFDAMKFWDRQHGILLGDPVAGHFSIFTTDNGGLTWTRGNQPLAIAGEGAFAASGTCLTLRGSHDAWFGTGGPGVARVLYSADRGHSWTPAATSLASRTSAAGIFSLVFLDAKRGVAVGGDYQKPAQSARTLAVTNDGGYTWNAPPSGIPAGFRSAVTYIKPVKLLIAVGTSGSDYSYDGGMTWTHLSNDILNAVNNDGDHVWAVGPKGLILKLAMHK